MSAITGVAGDYQFTGLAAGVYNVAELLPAGWLETSPGAPRGVGVLGEGVGAVPVLGNAAVWGLAWAEGYLYYVNAGLSFGGPEPNKVHRVDPATGATSEHDQPLRVVTSLDHLQGPHRREEIARMLSGAEITDEARAQAARLLAAE